MNTTCHFDDVETPRDGSGCGGSSGPPDRLTGLNGCEVNYALSNMSIIEPMINSKDLVESWLFTHNFQAGHFDGNHPYNAMKHALFQALNTCHIGSVHTLAMAERHEICNGELMNSLQSVDMDRRNNGVGIHIARSVGCNFDDLSNAVISAFLNGDLVKIDGSPTP